LSNVKYGLIKFLAYTCHVKNMLHTKTDISTAQTLKSSADEKIFLLTEINMCMNFYKNE